MYSLQEKALRDKANHLEQYQEVERKLFKLSSSHARKMKESEEQMQSLKVLFPFTCI